MNAKLLRILLIVIILGIAAGLFISRRSPFTDQARPAGRGPTRAVPVEAVAVEHGPIELRRTFSGTLEPRAEFVVAPKVGGRVERLNVNIADPVKRGEEVGALDDEEYVQALAQSRADLEVARANLAEAKNALEIAGRELARIETLRQRGVASESQLDAVKANELAKQAELEVAEAQVVRAEAALATARIRLGYTRITAGWSGGSDQRVVAERYVDEGETVAANASLLRIVELDPITGVVFVTERDYARLQPGQELLLVTDAFPGEEFRGHIERISPVFKEETRQARVELEIDNRQQRLKPGMFIRATVVLDQASDAVIVPEKALTKRNDRTGLFLLSDDGQSVRWSEVRVGIQDGERVQVFGEGLTGRVVTLGQQLLDDGSAVTVASGGADRQ